MADGHNQKGGAIMEILLLMFILLIMIVFPVLSLLHELGLNVPILLNILFLLISFSSMVWNYKTIKDNVLQCRQMNPDYLFNKLSFKIVVHTISWTVFVICFYLIMVS